MTLFVYTACGVPALFVTQTQAAPFTAIKGIDPQLVQLHNSTIEALQPNLISTGSFR